MPEMIDSQDEIDSWYRGKEFAFDWTSSNFPHWLSILSPLRSKDVKILEIGSYEGRSALFFLNYLPRSTITCVDAWDPACFDPDVVSQIPETVAAFSHAQSHFDRNLEPFGDRLTKIVGWSSDVLADLAIKSKMFDIIYVDGDHTSVGVYRDCMLSWPLLIGGGILIIDDYEFDRGLPDHRRPKSGVDAFQRTIRSQYDELHRAYQIVLRRKSKQDDARQYPQALSFAKQQWRQLTRRWRLSRKSD